MQSLKSSQNDKQKMKLNMIKKMSKMMRKKR